jgi:phage terminase large subunit-like protein
VKYCSAHATRPSGSLEDRRRPGSAGNLKPAKDKSTDRIDGIVANIMAIGRAMLLQEQFVEGPMAIWV